MFSIQSNWILIILQANNKNIALLSAKFAVMLKAL